MRAYCFTLLSNAVCLLYSDQCMYEFDVVLRYNIVTRGKNRLIVLMMLDSPVELLAAVDSPQTVVLRQYLRQFRYIDHARRDWRNKLLYALPLRPMDEHRDDAQLLQTV